MAEERCTAIALIPARGGSKRLPSKNLLPVAGRPLLAHTIAHALAAARVHEVYVSTEDEAIAAVARDCGAEVIARPRELASDDSTSEAALEHALETRTRAGRTDPDLVVFLQCTSPVRRLTDIDEAIETLIQERADSLFSACRDSSLLWALEDGEPHSLNYDFRARQREQEMEPRFRENGSIYVFRPSVLRMQRNRLGGRIAIYEMDYWSSFQVDTPDDVELLSWIMSRPEYSAPVSWPDQIELVVFDFDGVLTDNTVTVAGGGGELVRCDRGDGWGIARLRDAGVPLAVISTEANPVVRARCEKLGIPVEQGVTDKEAQLRSMLSERRVVPENVVYLGNDVNDLGCLRLVGLPVAVADAHASVIAEVQLVLTRRGGRGAVREFCDRLLAHLGSVRSA